MSVRHRPGSARAHFLTHDLVAAALVWFAVLALYAWLLKPRFAADDYTVAVRRPREFFAEVNEGTRD